MSRWYTNPLVIAAAGVALAVTSLLLLPRWTYWDRFAVGLGHVAPLALVFAALAALDWWLDPAPGVGTLARIGLLALSTLTTIVVILRSMHLKVW